MNHLLKNKVESIISDIREIMDNGAIDNAYDIDLIADNIVCVCSSIGLGVRAYSVDILGDCRNLVISTNLGLVEYYIFPDHRIDYSVVWD